MDHLQKSWSDPKGPGDQGSKDKRDIKELGLIKKGEWGTLKKT